MVFVAVNTTPIILPWPLRSSLEAAVRALLEPGDRPPIDFSQPIGEPALVSPDSVSWRVFKNPLSLFIGGVTAVIRNSLNRACGTAYGSTRLSV
ncbi:MAG: hypothetical protein WBW73_27250 [Rhodoplanes sp.]